MFYKGWLADRFNHGLSNTVGEYVGFDNSTIQYFVNKIDWDEMEFQNKIDQSYGLDQFLTKHWKYWDLVKFIVGYERWRPYGEVEEIQYTIPGVLRMAGYPVSHINIDPTPKGASWYEWTVSLPQYIVDGMKKSFAGEKILIGPRNTFGLYSMGAGLIKDGIKEVYSFVGGRREGWTTLLPTIKAYLMKRD